MKDYSSIILEVKPSIALVITFNDKNVLSGTGSGFVFWKNGVFVTCNHVVKDANAIFLKFPGVETPIPTKVLLMDEEHDLALLKFDDETRKPLIIADQTNISEGMPVIFSGYPINIQDLTTHQGIISSIAKDPTGKTVYLIDGTVNSGNSGCPLMDQNGKVIGVVNAKGAVRADIMEKVKSMSSGALSLYGLDLVDIYKVLINNVQLGIGYAVPAGYIPEHKEISNIKLGSDSNDEVAKKTNQKNGE